MRQAGLFGLSEHLERLSAFGDPLEQLGPSALLGHRFTVALAGAVNVG